MKKLAILGATGSIGATTLDLAGRFPDRFAVTALAAGQNTSRLADLARRFSPRIVAAGDEEAARTLRGFLAGFRGDIMWGEEGLHAVATEPDADLVVSALVGAVGLRPTLAAIEAGKDVALANKEVLVVAGRLVRRAMERTGVNCFPLDSEHNAIYQAIHGHRREDVRRIILTASGGPFLSCSIENLRSVTREQALRHPTWKMGTKVTIDSSTLMNKGLEVIEAHWLFDMPADRIAVVIHPQSIVHSMVEYVDGSVIAQMGIPDMAIPISYVLGYPERLPLDHLPQLDLTRAGSLEFAEPDLERFPCLALAYRALRAGGTMPAVLNAANEVLVQAFLDDAIAYLDIASSAAAVVNSHEMVANPSLDQLLDADRWARMEARTLAAATQTRPPATGATGVRAGRLNSRF
jgi:1-deoxy-D-xylulose-5-phosphate reductoisomerase